MNNEQPRKNLYVYILDTLADWEIAYICAEVSSKRFLSKDKNVQLTRVGNTMRAITTMGGHTIMPDTSLDRVVFQKGDVLLLPGADTWAHEDNQAVLNLVEGLIDRGVCVAAICGATVALAGRGLLDNRKHTSNDAQYLQYACPAYKGIDCYQNEAAVVDANLVTASGLAPLEFSREVLKKLDVMKEETLEAWYQLYTTRDAQSFFALNESLQ